MASAIADLSYTAGAASETRAVPISGPRCSLRRRAGPTPSPLRLSRLPDNRPHFLPLVLIRLKLREDIDEFANAAAWQRLAGVQ